MDLRRTSYKVKKENIFMKAILSGVYVTFVAVVYLITINTIGSKLIGGLLFSFALLVIVGRDYNLYTGKVGYLLPYEKGNLKLISLTLLGNIVGIIITGTLVLIANGTNLTTYALEQVELKFNNKLWHEILILAFFCGILMYTAVDGYKRIEDQLIKVLVVILSVVIFLLAGFEHSIANMVYIVLAKKFSFKIFIYLVGMILGNGLGAITFNLIHRNIYNDTESSNWGFSIFFKILCDKMYIDKFCYKNSNKE